MYKKHELIIGFIFWNYIFRLHESFEKYSKKKKIAESLRSISPIKKKVKHSKTTKTTFKSEWKK